MQCVILAGGLARRLGRRTEKIPKAMVPVAGQPFADHQLTWLASEGVTDVILAIGHLGDVIREFVGDGGRWGLRVRYCDERRELRGTAGALRLAHERGLLDDAFAVLYGDSYLDLSIDLVSACFRATKPAALMTVYRNDCRFDRSNARLLDGFVVHYEKDVPDPAAAGMQHIDYGFSIVSRDEIMPMIAADTPADLASVYERLSAQHRIRGYEIASRFYEIGSPAGLAELEALLASRTGP